jgi:hypothetical protein
MLRYVNQGECIFIRSRYNGFDAYGEAIVQRARESLTDALKGLLDENTVQVLLFDTETLKAEDITEEAAMVFLDGWNGDPGEDQVPDFVAQSEAYEAWCEQERIEKGFNARRNYGTYDARAL